MLFSRVHLQQAAISLGTASKLHNYWVKKIIMALCLIVKSLLKHEENLSFNWSTFSLGSQKNPIYSIYISILRLYEYLEALKWLLQGPVSHKNNTKQGGNTKTTFPELENKQILWGKKALTFINHATAIKTGHRSENVHTHNIIRRGFKSWEVNLPRRGYMLILQWKGRLDPFFKDHSRRLGDDGCIFW